MATDLRQGFRLGPWKVEPLIGKISGPNGDSQHLEPKVMDVFVCLAEHANELVTREELLDAVWNGQITADELLTGVVSDLRRALHNGQHESTYIETVPKRGYRLIGQVDPIANKDARNRVFRNRALWATAALLIAVLASVSMSEFTGLLFGGAKPITSIAVLPLKNISGDPDEEYFADGMTEELITELAKVGALKVVSSQSVMRFKDSDMPLPEIAEILDVDAIVEGSAMQLGDTIRITIQLIEAETDLHLWAEKYDRNFSDVLVLHSEIARSVAREIQVAVTPEDAVRLADVREVDPEVYRHYLRGEHYRLTWSSVGIDQAIEQYTHAITLDPEFASAYVGLARCYNLMAFLGYMPPRDAHAKKVEVLATALSLDSNLPQAHELIAITRYYYDWDWAGAEEKFREVIAISDNDAHVRQIYAWLLTALGRPDEAHASITRALELDPVSVQLHLVASDIFYFSRQFDQGRVYLEQADALSPNHPWVQMRFGWGYLQEGIHEEAISKLELTVQLAPGQIEPLWHLAHAYGVVGRPEDARRILNDLRNLARSQYVSRFGIAVVHVGLKEHDEALTMLETAYENRDSWMVYLNVLPYFDPLRQDPRFQTLLKRMNFPTVANAPE